MVHCKHTRRTAIHQKTIRKTQQVHCGRQKQTRAHIWARERDFPKWAYMDACILLFAVSASGAGFTRNYHSRGHICAANNYIGEYNLSLWYDTHTTAKIITQRSRTPGFFKRSGERRYTMKFSAVLIFPSWKSSSSDLIYKNVGVLTDARICTRQIFFHWTIFVFLSHSSILYTQLTQMIVISGRFKTILTQRARFKKWNGEKSVNI